MYKRLLIAALLLSLAGCNFDPGYNDSHVTWDNNGCAFTLMRNYHQDPAFHDLPWNDPAMNIQSEVKAVRAPNLDTAQCRETK